MRYVFEFNHRGRSVWFGPYPDEQEAAAAFQFRYGYWPESAESSRIWHPDGCRCAAC